MIDQNIKNQLEQYREKVRLFPMPPLNLVGVELSFAFTDALVEVCEFPQAKNMIRRGSLLAMQGHPNGANMQIVGFLSELLYKGLKAVAEDLAQHSQSH